MATEDFTFTAYALYDDASYDALYAALYDALRADMPSQQWHCSAYLITLL